MNQRLTSQSLSRAEGILGSQLLQTESPTCTLRAGFLSPDHARAQRCI
jgi:hypothetical protein